LKSQFGVKQQIKLFLTIFVSSCRVFVKHSKHCYSENIGMQPGILPWKWLFSVYSQLSYMGRVWTNCFRSHRCHHLVVCFDGIPCSHSSTGPFSY